MESAGYLRELAEVEFVKTTVQFGVRARASVLARAGH